MAQTWGRRNGAKRSSEWSQYSADDMKTLWSTAAPQSTAAPVCGPAYACKACEWRGATLVEHNVLLGDCLMSECRSRLQMEGDDDRVNPQNNACIRCRVPLLRKSALISVEAAFLKEANVIGDFSTLPECFRARAVTELL